MTQGRSLSELELELLAADDPDSARESTLTPADLVVVGQLRAQNERFRAQHDVNAWRVAFDQKHAAHLAPSATTNATIPWGRWRFVAPAFALACAAFVWLPARAPTSTEPATAATRSKGAQRLSLRVAKIEGTTFRTLADGALSHPGDVIQLQIDGSVGHSQLLVFSIDGRGTLTLHYPQHPGETLASDGRLPRSFELDDAPDFERFFLISGARLQLDELLQNAREMARNPRSDQIELEFPSHFPPDMAQSSFLLRKEVP